MSEEGGEQAGERLIVGLGNPGAEYRDTRHNLGFRVVELVEKRRQVTSERLECNARVGLGEGLILAQPQTYMNRSGYTVRCLVERYDLASANILIVFDDVHLKLGQLRMRAKGSPGGHRGMESVVNNLRTDEVPRLRLGVAGEGLDRSPDLSDYVLQSFERSEEEVVEVTVQRATEACLSWLDDGVETTMNRFNSPVQSCDAN